jgi:hypothetical protein
MERNKKVRRNENEESCRLLVFHDTELTLSYRRA